MIKLNCNELSDKILKDIQEKVNALDRKPGLAVIQVGNNPASTTYVRKKKEKAESLGFIHTQLNYDENITEKELIKVIDDLNNNDTIDGILVQLPLPKHINPDIVINEISPSKDVDGFSPINVGKLMLNQDCYIPCTPEGILEVIKYFNIPTEGKNVVVFGRSNIVGRPVANLFSQKPYNANVTLLHSYTSEDDKIRYVSNADIIILAVGIPNFLDYATYSNYIKPDATVIDVGINRIPDATKKSGFRLCGDFEAKGFEEQEELGNDVKYIGLKYTPVPGGIGITTTTMLMYNTLKARLSH